MSSTLYKKDALLIEACARGDENGWLQFIDAYGRLVRSTASKLSPFGVVAGADLEDLEAHVYEKLLEDNCRRLGAWRGRAKLSTYLVQVVRNLVLDYLKKENRGVRLRRFDGPADYPDETVHPGEGEYHEARRAALRRAIEELPPAQALVIRLRLEEKTLREIAVITNRPVGTVSVQNSRALDKLRSVMKDLPGVGDVG